jgi:hypothetical protein
VLAFKRSAHSTARSWHCLWPTEKGLIQYAFDMQALVLLQTSAMTDCLSVSLSFEPSYISHFELRPSLVNTILKIITMMIIIIIIIIIIFSFLRGALCFLDEQDAENETRVNEANRPERSSRKTFRRRR